MPFRLFKRTPPVEEAAAHRRRVASDGGALINHQNLAPPTAPRRVKSQVRFDSRPIVIGEPKAPPRGHRISIFFHHLLHPHHAAEHVDEVPRLAPVDTEKQEPGAIRQELGVGAEAQAPSTLEPAEAAVPPPPQPQAPVEDEIPTVPEGHPRGPRRRAGTIVRPGTLKCERDIGDGGQTKEAPPGQRFPSAPPPTPASPGLPPTPPATPRGGRVDVPTGVAVCKLDAVLEEVHVCEESSPASPASPIDIPGAFPASPISLAPSSPGVMVKVTHVTHHVRTGTEARVDELKTQLVEMAGSNEHELPVVVCRSPPRRARRGSVSATAAG